LHFWHKPGFNPLENTTAIIPLLVNPGENSRKSHVAGRFRAYTNGSQSFWIGFLADEEVEDNNEVLRKIKLAKRAIDRALPGFTDSIEKESICFEPRMIKNGPAHQKAHQEPVLGAQLITDCNGLQAVVDNIQRLLTEDSGG
jgi:hypothetical protein